MMPIRQKIATLLISLAVLVFVIELVRRRKLREEYSLIWLLTSLAMIVFVLRYDWLIWLTELIGAKVVTTTLFLLGLLFLIIINIHFSVRISKLNTQVKNLAQENALLKNRIDETDKTENKRK